MAMVWFNGKMFHYVKVNVSLCESKCFTM